MDLVHRRTEYSDAMAAYDRERNSGKKAVEVTFGVGIFSFLFFS